jgi:hypothetical protein
MNLYDQIVAVYPELKEDPSPFLHGQILLQDDSDGKGAYIKEWNHSVLLKPTPNQLSLGA